MIVNWCTYITKKGMREAFCHELEASGYLGKCRNYTLWYELYLPADGSDRVVVYQGWADQAHIDLHRQAEYMHIFRELKAYYVLDTKSEACTVDELEVIA